MSLLSAHLAGLPIEEVLLPLSGISVGLITATIAVRARRLRAAMRRSK